MEVINKERAERKEKGMKMDPNNEYGKTCPACEKPNSVKVVFCTGCSFPLTEEDIIELPKNIFLDILKGKEKGTPILYRDEKVALWDDKFGVSQNHIDVVPVEEIVDVTHLNKTHIPLIEAMYEAGLNEFKRRQKEDEKAIPFDIEECMVAGYNFPVSVKHLHLHVILPPFKHKKVLAFPRWHPHKKILKDLKEHGQVHIYDEVKDKEAGDEEYNTAMEYHDKYAKAYPHLVPQ
eukprot:CAMPEP_0117423246 /NCGR_PEP_ID=MMETSP0758-20121206/3917_1 /TAXON_ID=63605 /ORGANISM="Percolomonas cosmopolitus, Strain AE-1 (ATCC 50343)" /LENGTH=233 /DNA_ID=CAMNT_0005206337 /DNA_START=179 /DNA_END=880 /DNA_ORIENTATION=-